MISDTNNLIDVLVDILRLSDAQEREEALIELVKKQHAVLQDLEQFRPAQSLQLEKFLRARR